MWCKQHQNLVEYNLTHRPLYKHTQTHSHDNSNNQGSDANQIDLLSEKLFDLGVTVLTNGETGYCHAMWDDLDDNSSIWGLPRRGLNTAEVFLSWGQVSESHIVAPENRPPLPQQLSWNPEMTVIRNLYYYLVWEEFVSAWLIVCSSEHQDYLQSHERPSRQQCSLLLLIICKWKRRCHTQSHRKWSSLWRSEKKGVIN